MIDPTRQQLNFSQINGNNKLLLAIDFNSGKAEEFRQFSNEGKPNQLAKLGDDFLILTEDPKSMTLMALLCGSLSKMFSGFKSQ